jgi:hypothetical protein
MSVPDWNTPFHPAWAATAQASRAGLGTGTARRCPGLGRDRVTRRDRPMVVPGAPFLRPMHLDLALRGARK